MTEEQANKMVEVVEQSGYDCDIREDYSGRGMYGRTTYGVVCKVGPREVKDLLVEHFIEEREMDDDDFDRDDYDEEELYEEMSEHELFPSLRSDTMGLSVIYY